MQVLPRWRFGLIPAGVSGLEINSVLLTPSISFGLLVGHFVQTVVLIAVCLFGPPGGGVVTPARKDFWNLHD